MLAPQLTQCEKPAEWKEHALEKLCFNQEEDQMALIPFERLSSKRLLSNMSTQLDLNKELSQAESAGLDLQEDNLFNDESCFLDLAPNNKKSRISKLTEFRERTGKIQLKQNSINKKKKGFKGKLIF